MIDARLGLFVLPAVLFAALYFPAVTRFSVALASPYAKASLDKRLVAATMDGVPVVTAYFLYRNSGSALFLATGALYLLLRDSYRGQSLGKFLMGLVVIRVETGRPSALKESIWRNVVLLIPGANLIAIFLEPITVMRDPQGQRLGDKLAQTQVVEGRGAKDLAASFQQWWRGVAPELERALRKPRGEPVEVER